MKTTIFLSASALALSSFGAQAETLRLLTWGGYAPENVIEMFEAETGHTVEVTKSNNEEMIAKLRATNEAWGIRDVGDLATIAEGVGLVLKEKVDMPANNLTLCFVKSDTSPL